MKTLLDIQQELRKLENSMNGMINTVNNLSEDVEKLRNDGKESHMNYEAISKRAKKIPFHDHPLKRIKDRYVCRLYIDVLLNLVRLDTENTLDKLVFIEWIRLESKIDMSLEELQKDSVVKLSDGTLWEVQTALYFRWTCLPDYAVPELAADYRRNNRRLP